MEAREVVSFAIMRLLDKQRYYAHFINQMRQIYTKEVPTMEVSVTDKINLYINPDFVMEKGKVIKTKDKDGNDTEYTSMSLGGDVSLVAKALKHEVLHILCHHIPRYKDIGVDTAQKHHLFNLATDATINTGDLKELADIGGVSIEKLNNKMREYDQNHVDIEENKSAEHIYGRLLKFTEEHGDKLPKTSTDSHDKWGSSTDSKEGIEEVVKQVAKEAAERSGGIGNLPSEIVAKLEELFKSKVNWKKELRRFQANSVKSEQIGTRTKRHRRYGIYSPGKKFERKQKIVYCVDTSGSMSDYHLAQCWGELVSLHKNGVEIVVIEADCKAQSVYKFEPKKTPTFKGRGGTAYQPAIDEAKKHNPDAIFYFGDFDSSDIPVDPKIPFLWIGVGKQKPPGDFGKVIYIPDEKK